MRPSTAWAKRRGSSARVSRITDSATASTFLARWSTSLASSAWRCSASRRAVTSRVIASCAVRPSGSGSGAARVSIRRRPPRRPTMSNSQLIASPRHTRAWFACQAARSSGAISEKTERPSTSSGPSASIMRRPAGFIRSKVPSDATTLMHSGVVSNSARSRASLSASAASAALRPLMSTRTLTAPMTLPAVSRSGVG